MESLAEARDVLEDLAKYLAEVDSRIVRSSGVEAIPSAIPRRLHALAEEIGLHADTRASRGQSIVSEHQNVIRLAKGDKGLLRS